VTSRVNIDRLVITVSRPEAEAQLIARHAAATLHARLAHEPPRRTAIGTLSIDVKDSWPSSSGPDLGARIGHAVASRLSSRTEDPSAGGTPPC
jgi:hypothetical protein